MSVLPLSQATQEQEREKWRAQWIANIRIRARREVPRWLRSVPVLVRQETEPIPRTLTIPIVRLLPENETRALVSEAVRWFYQRRHCLPSAIALNPLRCLAVNQTFFPVDCEDLGCYTVEIYPAAELAKDMVMVVGQVVSTRSDGRCVWGKVTDFYLCIEELSSQQVCVSVFLHSC